ncbi:MAG: phosphoribosylanthranilate isomerase [Candidatus Aerophobetes bacterium]|nr:phosphoribosylanthranilate isomerase [Candidatus Aerophobetes bacterium]
MVKIKICGITSLKDALLCIKEGVDFLGFVTEYPVSVPWNVSREKAQDLIRKVKNKVNTVVVTSGEVSKILEIAQFTSPHFLQLHGKESLIDMRRITKKLKKRGIRVIKALSLNNKTYQAFFEIQDPLKAAKALEKVGIFALTLDSKTSAMPAGTGVPLNWELAKKIKKDISLPLILAGGLSSANVKRAIRIVKPFAVDVLSGVETDFKKDPEKVSSFIKEVRKKG